MSGPVEPHVTTDIRKRLQEAGIQYVRILWCDHAGLIRGKAAHVSTLGPDFDGVGIAAAQQALPVMFDAIAPDSGLGPVGEARLMPDWTTLKILPYASSQAQAIGDMIVDGLPWDQCPREYLRTQLRRMEAEGLRAFAAFENEFFLIRRTAGGYEPADTTVYAATASMNEHQGFIHDLTEALRAQDLQPEFYYPESAPGQQEVSVRYAGAAEAADNQITYRETVRGVARRHGLVASFLPKIYEHAAGSGCHLNLSLWRGDRNVMGDAGHATGISTPARHFIAGVMAHLHGLAALTIPAHNSYRRIRPRFWAGAYRAWGYHNREAAIRVSRGKNGATRFELKTCDATANPYLALGGLLAAGLDGLRRELDLPSEVAEDPDAMMDAERERNRVDLLPQSLEQALDAFERDTVLRDSFGPARTRAYLAVKRMEWEALRNLSLADEVRMLAERY
jgi:glutamine synthetase